VDSNQNLLISPMREGSPSAEKLLPYVSVYVQCALILPVLAWIHAFLALIFSGKESPPRPRYASKVAQDVEQEPWCPNA
jgi:hypothetical protein